VVLVLARSSGRVLSRPSGPRQWAALGLVGVIGGSVPFLLFFEGLRRASSSDAAFLHKTLVLWVALLAVPLLGERIGALQWGAIGLLVLGQASLAGGMTTPLDMAWGPGEALVLAATLCWSVETVLVKSLLTGLTSWTVALARMGLGSVLLLGWSASRGELSAVVRLDAEQLGWVLVTGLLLAGYVATWFGALARAQAVDVTAVLVVGALVTAALSAVVNGTDLGPQVTGLVLVAGGSLVLLGGRRHAPEAA
jgi:drug/metabolite transporter (DMT)-like permease